MYLDGVQPMLAIQRALYVLKEWPLWARVMFNTKVVVGWVELRATLVDDLQQVDLLRCGLDKRGCIALKRTNQPA
jgi:hypothetical protein